MAVDLDLLRDGLAELLGLNLFSTTSSKRPSRSSPLALGEYLPQEPGLLLVGVIGELSEEFDDLLGNA